MRTEPVVLVHGFASSFELNWREPGWIDLLTEAGRDVIGIDLLGHGEAEKPHEPEAYAHLEDYVADRMPVGEPVDGVGFSLGARVLLTLAAREPGRFARLVVAGVGQNLFADDRTQAGRLADAVAGGAAAEDVTAGLFARFAAGSGNDREALAACLRRPAPRLTADDLARITLPVLVVIGDQDFAGPPDPLLAALPDATLAVIKRCDHFATPNRVEFLEAALEFLDAVPTFS